MINIQQLYKDMDQSSMYITGKIGKDFNVLK